MSGLLLLDVNVLLALGWKEHEAHSRVITRLDASQAWATCAIVQLGFIRLSGTAGIFHQPLSPERAAQALQVLVADHLHKFLDDSVVPCEVVWSAASGPKQTTDVYLLALAEKYGARLLTLDQRLARAFPNSALEILP